MLLLQQLKYLVRLSISRAAENKTSVYTRRVESIVNNGPAK